MPGARQILHFASIDVQLHTSPHAITDPSSTWNFRGWRCMAFGTSLSIKSNCAARQCQSMLTTAVLSSQPSTVHVTVLANNFESTTSRWDMLSVLSPAQSFWDLDLAAALARHLCCWLSLSLSKPCSIHIAYLTLWWYTKYMYDWCMHNVWKMWDRRAGFWEYLVKSTSIKFIVFKCKYTQYAYIWLYTSIHKCIVTDNDCILARKNKPGWKQAL